MDIYGLDERLVEDQALEQASEFPTVCWNEILMDLVDDEKSCMLLVMRVLSIVPLNFKVRQP